VRRPRMDRATKEVLEHLAAAPDFEDYGLAICKALGRPTGTVHPILYRFEARGWLESRMEKINSVVAGRPKRRYYRLTEVGHRELTSL
jgi:PadR family transcriptional regulator PadR